MAGESWPKWWGHYVGATKEKGLSLDRELAVWAARFRAARAFSGVTFDGLSEKSSQGYFVGLKLTLVESALETYEKAVGISVGTLGVFDPDLSYELWEERSSELANALRRLENPRLQRSFQEFLNSDKDTCQEFDLRVLLRSFRHLTAHGFFNPSSAGVYTSPVYRALLLRLADEALRSCEEDFHAEVLVPLVDPTAGDDEIVFAAEDLDEESQGFLNNLLAQAQDARERDNDERPGL